jgi:CheY-like chemotaxis protein
MDRVTQKILIVDDNEALVQLFAAGLMSLGCENVTAFDDAEEAMQHLSENEVNILITDLSMPKIDGLDFVIAARKKGIRRIIVMSGTPNQEALDKVAELGVCFFLKPCHVGRIFEMVMADDSEFASCVEAGKMS